VIFHLFSIFFATSRKQWKKLGYPAMNNACKVAIYGDTPKIPPTSSMQRAGCSVDENQIALVATRCARVVLVGVIDYSLFLCRLY
jgi:hypothetical protein